MPCNIKNPANYQLGDLESHVHGMYDHFESKYGFKKPPTMVFDSDPGNQSKVLGKTAYYDPQSLEIHIYVDGRHPKDVLRSIAHELIHHRQNMEGRLDTDGYSGPGYYLENDSLKEVEHEAMLDGNATMREYEDTVKYKEKDKMSLKEWKNNELNRQLLKRFGILKEEIVINEMGDGQSMDAVESAKEELRALKRNQSKMSEEEFEKQKRPIMKKYFDAKKIADSAPDPLAEQSKPDFLDLDKDGDKEEPMADAANASKGEDKEDLEESTSGRHADADRRQGKDREYADRLREADGEEEEEEVVEEGELPDALKKYQNKNKKDSESDDDDSDEKDEEPKQQSLQEAIKKIARARKVFLNGKRIK